MKLNKQWAWRKKRGKKTKRKGKEGKVEEDIVKQVRTKRYQGGHREGRRERRRGQSEEKWNKKREGTQIYGKQENLEW